MTAILIIILIILAYLSIGVIGIGTMCRFAPELHNDLDSSEKAMFVIFWPIGGVLGLMGLLGWLVDKVAGK